MKNSEILFMQKKLESLIASFILSAMFLLSGCASTTEGGMVGMDRKQFMLVSSAELEAKSSEAYEQVKKKASEKKTLDRNPAQLRRLQMISQRLIPQVGFFRKDSVNWKWEVHVEDNPELNAYCMPGGKIMFYSGIIDKLQLTDDEIAAIMGHEIAHALREHGREQMSEQILKLAVLQVGVQTGVVNEKYAGALMLLSNFMIDLPHSRNQETEADVVGLELMARGGYNPEAAIRLWEKMASNGGGKPPEFMSTHPSDESRIRKIRAILPKVTPLYQRAAGQ